jgi:hypothetical protein
MRVERTARARLHMASANLLPRIRNQGVHTRSFRLYEGVLISLWLFLFPIFLFAAQPK